MASLHTLILDEPKPWLNARVNNLVVDGTATIDNIVVEDIVVDTLEANVIKGRDAAANLEILLNGPEPELKAEGTNANINVKISPKGASGIVECELNTIKCGKVIGNAAAGHLELDMETNQIATVGSDADIDLFLAPKGAGEVKTTLIGGELTASRFLFDMNGRVISAEGTSATRDINIVPGGTGKLRLGSGSSAPEMFGIVPSGADATAGRTQIGSGAPSATVQINTTAVTATSIILFSLEADSSTYKVWSQLVTRSVGSHFTVEFFNNDGAATQAPLAIQGWLSWIIINP